MRMIGLHPELLHAPFLAWALFSEWLEDAGLGPLAALLLQRKTWTRRGSSATLSRALEDGTSHSFRLRSRPRRARRRHCWYMFLVACWVMSAKRCMCTRNREVVSCSCNVHETEGRPAGGQGTLVISTDLDLWLRRLAPARSAH